MCVCVCVCGVAIAQLIRESSYGVFTSGTLKGRKFKSAMASYGIISLSKKLTHICFSQLRNINEYLVIDWGKRPSAVT